MRRKRLGGIALFVVLGVAGVLAIAAVILAIGAWSIDPARRGATADAASVQAFAAAVSLLGTAVLVAATGYYAWTTHQLVEQGQPAVTVALRRGWTDLAATGVMTAPIGQSRPTGSPAHLTEPIFAIEVRNAGGAAVTVEKASIAMKKGITFGLTSQNVGPALPHRLESHSSATFYIDQVNPGMFHDSAQLLHVARPKFRAEVVLGSGEVVGSEWIAVTAEH